MLRHHTFENVGPFGNNVYVIHDPASREAAIVDVGFEPHTVIDWVRREGLQPRWLLATHAHYDHVASMHAMQQAFPVPFALHPLDQPLLDNVALQGSMFGLPPVPVPAVGLALAHGQRIPLGDEALDVLRQGMRDAVVDAAFVRRVAVDLLDAGHGEEALAVLDATAPRFPLDAELVLLRRLAFPSVFRDAGEPARWRERLSRGLASLSLDDPELAALPHAALIDATLRFNPYYVDYLGDVSRDLHDAWGDWLARLLSASASTGAAPMEGATPAPRAADGRIRIGIVGDTLRAHVVSELDRKSVV